MANFILLQANALHLPLASESVHCCITSIPYWGLRAYGTDPQVWPDGWHGELGLEPDPSLFVDHVVEVFREVKRVLRRDGTLWLNIGDSYATAPNGRSAAATKDAGNDDRTFRDKPFGTATGGLKPKDLVGMPWRVALALQVNGWWLRSDVIWSKKNPLPSSVKDRPAMSHEYLFMLTRSARYYYDALAVREPAKYGRRIHDASAPTTKYRDGAPGQNGVHNLYFKKTKGADPSSGRNLRTVWHLATQPLSAKRFGADVEHFAAFPEKLVEPCILAAPDRVCAKCGAPWARVTKPTKEYERFLGKGYHDHSKDLEGGMVQMRGGVGPQSIMQKYGVNGAEYETLAWRPTCRCQRPERLETKPAVILDPFCGSATTGVVALRHGRDFVGCDLSHDYLSGLAVKRIEHSLTEKHRKPRVPRPPRPEQLTLPGT